jgi:hypothetical protein
MLATGRKTIVSTNLHATVPRCYKQLYHEGRNILRCENKFVGIEGTMDHHPNVAYRKVLKILALVPYWHLGQMKIHYGTSTELFSSVNITVKISEASSMRTFPTGKMFMFPIGCLEVVCQALSYLPANRVYNREAAPPLLNLNFSSGLSCAALGQKEGYRDSKAFRDILSRVLISPLGRFIANTNVLGFDPAAHDDQCLDCVNAWFVGQVELRYAEEAQAALHRALKVLIEAWKDGERVITATNDPRQALGHFYVMRQICCLITWNTDWRQFLSGELNDCLDQAYSWACSQIANSPIANEASHMQATVTSGAQVHVSEAIRSIALLSEQMMLMWP